jgi:hypothetical protein
LDSGDEFVKISCIARRQQIPVLHHAILTSDF